MRDNQYEYEYHNVADDADFFLDQDDHTQDQFEVQEYNEYYHNVLKEIDE